MDDGTAPPEKKRFENTQFIPDERTFKGTIDWDEVHFGGALRWEYTMVFSPDYENIESGTCKITNANGTTGCH